MPSMPNLGATPQSIQAAATALNVVFPADLVTIWTISNGLELDEDWRFFPVFDASNPGKSAGHIVSENTKGRWDTMPADLITIADDGAGNALVLRKSQQSLDTAILHWNHETGQTQKWSHDLAYIIDVAHTRVKRIQDQIARASANRRKPT